MVLTTFEPCYNVSVVIHLDFDWTNPECKSSFSEASFIVFKYWVILFWNSLSHCLVAASASIQSPTPWLILTTVLYCWEEVLFFVLKYFSPNLTVLILIKWFSSVQRMRLQKVLKSELRFPSRNPPMNIVAIQFSSTFWHARIGLRCFKSCLQLSNGDMWVTLFPYLLFSWSLCDSFAGCPFIEFLFVKQKKVLAVAEQNWNLLRIIWWPSPDWWAPPSYRMSSDISFPLDIWILMKLLWFGWFRSLAINAGQTLYQGFSFQWSSCRVSRAPKCEQHLNVYILLSGTGYSLAARGCCWAVEMGRS